MSNCYKCKYEENSLYDNPCRSCIFPKFEPSDQTLKCDYCKHNKRDGGTICNECTGSNWESK